MARLQSLKPSLSVLRPALARSGGSEAERLAERDRTQAWRAWYKTARWQRLRMVVLKRDRWTCQATGVPLVGKYPAPNSPVVDHIVPHRGDEALFWAEDNLQAVSRDYHDRVKQGIERRGQV